MWHWDQGHLSYFQFESLQRIASFVVAHDFKNSDRAILFQETGLQFKAPDTHSAWRNYSRALKLCLLVYEQGDHALATPAAQILSQRGAVTCDEFMHFLVEASTEPSPALEGWNPNATFRYPLLFSLKYLLAKTAVQADPFASLHEIIGAYGTSGMTGEEDASAFANCLRAMSGFETAGASSPANLRRQSKESLKVISQISYLHFTGGKNPQIEVSLDPVDAHTIFESLHGIGGPRASARELEIYRLASLFSGGSVADFFDYPNTILSDVVESGFAEGTKVKKTHVTIERNRNLRKAFFDSRPTSICDLCHLDTARTYEWTDRILDIHHLLPLSSGTQVEARGTTFDDLVPVCPTCHRATHRYYDRWLRQHDRRDFLNAKEARDVYCALKNDFRGIVHAQS